MNDDPVTLWAEIHKLRALLQGPPGFDSWQSAAIDERMRRVTAERAAATGWQPIATAPKDGAYFLAGNAKGAWIAHWQPTAVSGYQYEQPWRSCMLNHDHMPADSRYRGPPTHWMPLPTPPVVDDVVQTGPG